MKRILYIAYYVREMNWALLRKFINYAAKVTGRSRVSLAISMITNALKYNISLLEYFQFRFFEKTHAEKVAWAGTGFMYEYQLGMNPKSKREILNDKRLFAREYSDFLVHQVEDTETLRMRPESGERILSNPSGRIVFKASDGKCGAQVSIANASNYDVTRLAEQFGKPGFDLVEEFIVQHPSLQNLSPSAVNTVRIFTQLDADNQVQILGCRLRISVNSSVDNMAAGNLAAPVDERTGYVCGPGVYSDISKPDEEVHPVTGVRIVGFQIPFWAETIEMVKRAALSHPQNRSIGWDVVITESGPGLIEGNHDWCKLLWQLPVKRGLKSELLKYL